MTACPICGGATSPDPALGGVCLRRCADCRFAFLEGADDEAAELYVDGYFADYVGGDYREQEPQRRHESRLRLDWIERWSPPPGRLFEVGAASGFFLDEARHAGYAVSGVEVSGSMSAHARSDLDLDVTTSRVEDAELPDRAFDVVCAWHVLEHLPDPLGSVRRLAAALAPGGHLAVEVPNLDSALARKMGPSWPALDLPHHVGHHSPVSMRTLLQGAGLEVIEIETIPFAFYDRHRWPRAVKTARVALESLRARTLLSAAPHESAHQILRAIAVRPA